MAITQFENELITKAKMNKLVDGINGLQEKNILIEDNTIITVGNGGDYVTINEALAYLSKCKPLYKNVGVRATIQLLAGFVMQEQVLIDGIDFGWVTISGVDSETIIDKNYLTIGFNGKTNDTRYPAFGVKNGGCLPIINQLFNMTTTAINSADGICVIDSSLVIIGNGKGVKNSATHGLYVINNSIVEGRNCIFNGSASTNAYIQAGSHVNLRGSDLQNSINGLYVEGGSNVNANNANISNTGSNGIVVLGGSIVSANGSTGTLSQSPNTITANGIIFK